MPCSGLRRPVDLLGKPVPDHHAVNSEIFHVVAELRTLGPTFYRLAKLRHAASR